ncbi:BTAD domain-containing putative transcriptional regulator [Candidatus Bipolaricaulota bacterium]
MSPPKLEIKLFGRFEVLRDGEPIPEEAWGRRKTKTLFKVLLTNPGHVFTNDQLIDALFGGENVDKATENLYGRVSQLRRALEPRLKRGVDSTFILRAGQGYSFNADAAVEIDVIVFQEGVEEAATLAEAKEWMSAVERYDVAIALYRGEFLAEDRYEDWAEEVRANLQQQFLDALLELAASYEQLGRLRQSISCCQRALAIEPHRERVIQQLMEYQAQACQRGAALETYKEGERALREYLGVEPPPGMQALQARLSSEESAEAVQLDPRRVAVLPLQCYSSDPEAEHIANGMTEELTGTLSKIRDLRVVARTSVMRYKDTRQSICQISRELNVGTLLEGSVRMAEDELRVSVQLIDAASEDHLWAEEYDRSYGDFLSTQRDVAEQVARALQIELLSDEEERVSSLPTQSTEAHLLYMKGLRHISSGTDLQNEKSISSFEEAIAIDPAFAGAFAKIAFATMLLSRTRMTLDNSLPRVRESLERAEALDPRLPEVHAMRGLFHWAYERDSVEAEAAIRRAIQLNPSYIEAHECMRDLMGQCGRYTEELAEAREALALSPGLDPDLYCGVGRALIHAGRFEEAIGFFEEAGAIDPEYPGVLGGLASAKERLWRWEEAEELRRKLRALHPTAWGATADLVRHLHSRGRIEESLQLVRSFSCDHSNEVRDAYLEGLSLMLARRHREAIDVFSRCAETHNLGLAHTGWTTINQLRATAHAEIEEYDEALLYYQAALDESQSFGVLWTPPIWETGIACTKARIGDNQAVPELIRRFLGQSDDLGIPTLLAILYFSEANPDEGFKWLNIAVDRYAPRPLRLIKVHPWFDPACDDPRFTAVLERMNLSE